MTKWLTQPKETEASVKTQAAENCAMNPEGGEAPKPYQPSEEEVAEATAAGFSQTDIDAAALTYDPQGVDLPFVAFLQTTKETVEASVPRGWLTPAEAPLGMTASQAQAMVVKAFGYTDLAGKMNAAVVLGTAQATIFNEAISDAWKKHGKDCKAAVLKLSKWGAPVSMPAIRDAVAKVLIANKISTYPPVVAAIADRFKSANPFQTSHMIPDERGDQQTGSKLARS